MRDEAQLGGTLEVPINQRPGALVHAQIDHGRLIIDESGPSRTAIRNNTQDSDSEVSGGCFGRMQEHYSHIRIDARKRVLDLLGAVSQFNDVGATTGDRS